MSVFRLFFILLIFLTFSCSKEVNDFPAMERPLPFEVNLADREKYRKLPIQGAHNFRDLGGYKTRDNRAIKWGVLYRSDALHELTDQDIKYLERLKLNKVIDFRSPPERAEDPDRIISNTDVHLLSIDPFQEMGPKDSDMSFEDIQQEMFSGNLDLSNFLVDFNKILITEFTPIYKEFIDLLIANEGSPLVFHCTAGKDRAGLAAALVLSALGVPREIIIEDYLATNIYSKESIDKKLTQIKFLSFFQADIENIRKVMKVEERYIQEAFNVIDSEWGGIDAYLKDGLMLSHQEIDKLRSIYLE